VSHEQKQVDLYVKTMLDQTDALCYRRRSWANAWPPKS